MRQRLLERLGDLIVRRHRLVLVLLIALGAIAGYGMSRLEINSNQIDLLDQDLRPVRELQRITQMTGGTGFLFLALKGDDPDHLKAASDDLAARIEAMPEVRSVTYKQEAPAFIRKHILLYLKTKDLTALEAEIRAKLEDVPGWRKEIERKVRAEIRRQNPFSIELTEQKEEEPTPLEALVTELVEKYRSMGKKGIEDDYYISRDLDLHEDPAARARLKGRFMMLLLIKPVGESTDLLFTAALIEKLDALIANFNEQNEHRAKVLEGYDAPADGATITYGYTGGYKLNLDDYDTIQASLVPTSLIALGGILVVLLFFLRRPTAIALLLVALLYGLLLTFGFAALAVGKLNVITAVMGCILQGLGIDYGIHLFYRLREEFVLTRDLDSSIRMAILHSGSACLATSLTTAAAFFVMMLSEFRGFSDFGLLAGVGVVLIAFSTYVVMPTAILTIAHRFPGFPVWLLGRGGKVQASEIRGLDAKRFPFAWGIIVVAVGLTAAAGWAARKTDFDYNARTLMVPDQPSIVLQQEINDRFQISSDPVAIYCETKEDYQRLFDTMHPEDLKRYNALSEVEPKDQKRYTRFAVHPLDRERYPTVDEVVSLCLMVPPPDQQARNMEVMERMRQDLARLRREELALPEGGSRARREASARMLQLFDAYEEALTAKPFDFDALAEIFGDQFRAVPDAREKFPGWLTFIYPKVSLWDGRDLLDFADEVGVIEAPDGTEFHSTGIAILFAKLASIVLSDGKQFTTVSFAVVFLLVLLNFRKLGATLTALIPLVVGLVWMVGAMQLFDMRLNFINIVVLTLIFGYGIDTGIHLYHRFVETGSVVRAVRMTGGAVLASMLTAVVGWGALGFAEHRGLQSMGLLACLGIGSALVVSLTLLPALLQVIADRMQRGYRREDPLDA